MAPESKGSSVDPVFSDGHIVRVINPMLHGLFEAYNKGIHLLNSAHITACTPYLCAESMILPGFEQMVAACSRVSGGWQQPPLTRLLRTLPLFESLLKRGTSRIPDSKIHVSR